MFKYFFFFILLFLNIFFASSQKLKVLDAKTKLPIPYANYILFFDTNVVKGGYCSDEGAVYVPHGVSFNKISLTSIGYENLDIFKQNIINDTLLLTPAIYHLKEVTITSNKKKKFIDLG